MESEADEHKAIVVNLFKVREFCVHVGTFHFHFRILMCGWSVESLIVFSMVCRALCVQR